MEFYFPTHAFPQRHMHYPSQVRQHAFYPQYDDIEVLIVEEEPRQKYHQPLFGEKLHYHHRYHPVFGEGLHHQQLYQQEQARRYRQQQREYALEQQRLREEQAALYMLYRQKEQERIRHQQEQERIRRQQEQELLRRQQEQREELYRRRIAKVLEERERRRQQLQQQQHAFFSLFFSQEDTDMEEPQQQSEEHPQQVAQSEMEIQQEVQPEQEEEAQHQEPQDENSHQESEDDTSLNIRFLFSPETRSVASDDGDHDMTPENDQVAVHNQDQSDAMATDEQTSSKSESESESESEDQHIWERVSDDEKLADTKHLQLRMLGEQLEQLDEKHNNTIPTTRLQFADDSSSEVTAISRENRQFLGLEDEVLQVMLQLDAVDSNGDESIRQERKSLIRKAEQLLAKMDEHKQQEWERISVGSASSA